MEADLVGEAPLPGLDPQDVDDELAQLVGPGHEAPEIGAILFVFEKKVIVFADHAGAASRRADDIVVAPERFQDLPGELGRVPETAGIEHRLAAAGLVRGILESHAEPVEDPDGGHADMGIGLVDVAGDEQAHPAQVASLEPSHAFP